MFLELAKFASLLLSILSLDAVFHTAFLEPDSNLQQQLFPSVRMLLVAAAVSLASGCLFRLWENGTPRQGSRPGSVAGSLPMLIFYWGAGAMVLLFAAAWLLERYYLVLWR